MKSSEKQYVPRQGCDHVIHLATECNAVVRLNIYRVGAGGARALLSAEDATRPYQPSVHLIYTRTTARPKPVEASRAQIGAGGCATFSGILMSTVHDLLVVMDIT